MLFIHSSVDRNLGYFYLLAITNNAAMHIYVQVFLCMYVFIFLGCIRSSGIAGSYSNSMFNYLRNCQTGFHGGPAVLHSYRQYMRAPISPHSCQYFLLSVFDSSI